MNGYGDRYGFCPDGKVKRAARPAHPFTLNAMLEGTIAVYNELLMETRDPVS